MKNLHRFFEPRTEGTTKVKLIMKARESGGRTRRVMNRVQTVTVIERNKRDVMMFYVCLWVCVCVKNINWALN